MPPNDDDDTQRAAGYWVSKRITDTATSLAKMASLLFLYVRENHRQTSSQAAYPTAKREREREECIVLLHANIRGHEAILL